MLEELMRKALGLVTSEEAESSYSESESKSEAIRQAIALFSKETQGTCFDLGSEVYSKRLLKERFDNVYGYNLKDGDMHNYIPAGKSPAIFARHVLEHSPFPLYMLCLLREALKGEMVVVVPKPETEWVLNHPAHVSVLPKEQWEKLFKLSGFEIKKCIEGTWTKEGHVEYRYLLV